MRELQREAQRIGGDRAHFTVMRRVVGVGRVDVDLFEMSETARVVHHFDQIVFVFTRLDAKLEVALHRAG